MTEWTGLNEEMKRLLDERGWGERENIVVSLNGNYMTFLDRDTGERKILQRYEV